MPSKEYYYSTIVDVLPFNSAEISLIENYYDSQLMMEYLPNIPKKCFVEIYFQLLPSLFDLEQQLCCFAKNPIIGAKQLATCP